MTLNRLNHALAFVFGGYQDYEKFYTPALMEEDAGLFVAILEQLCQKTKHAKHERKHKDALTTCQVEHGTAKKSHANMHESEKLSDEVQESAIITEHTETEEECENHVDNTEGTSLPEQPIIIEQQDKSQHPPSVRMTGEEVNAVRLALAHVNVKLLKDHDFNIFESAFFYGPNGDRGEYILNGLQVAVSYLGMFYLFYFLGVEIRRTYEDRDIWLRDDEGNDKEWLGILAINAIGLGYFFFLLGKDVERVKLFNRCMIKLCPVDPSTSRKVRIHRLISLTNNFIVNIYLGYALFVLNFFFVQAVDNMVDAILNAIAVVFIIQIDDIIPPYVRDDRTVYFLSIPCCGIKPRYWLDWENKKIHKKLMEVVEAFLTRPLTSDEAVFVRKRTGKSLIFRQTDVCYCFVNKESSMIRIFTGRMRKRSGKYTHNFEEVCYEIGGEGAAKFLDHMAQFSCVQAEHGKKVLTVDHQQIKRASKTMLVE